MKWNYLYKLPLYLKNLLNKLVKLETQLVKPPIVEKVFFQSIFQCSDHLKEVIVNQNEPMTWIENIEVDASTL